MIKESKSIKIKCTYEKHIIGNIPSTIIFCRFSYRQGHFGMLAMDEYNGIQNMAAKRRKRGSVDSKNFSSRPYMGIGRDHSRIYLA
jgi:hypothetical protein